MLAALVPAISFANTIHFKCHAVDSEGVHKFDASGVVSVDDLDTVEGFVSLHVEKAQSAQSVQSFEDMRVNGFMRHYSAGEVGSKKFDQIVLRTNEPYIKSLNLVMGYSDGMDSRVFSIDNFAYRSNCTILSRHN